MNPHLTLAVNMGMVPGVTSTGLEHRPDGTVIVTVHGGNPVTVARMILSCLPPWDRCAAVGITTRTWRRPDSSN